MFNIQVLLINYTSINNFKTYGDLILNFIYVCMWRERERERDAYLKKKKNGDLGSWVYMSNFLFRFKYRFGPQYLAFVSNWFLTFQMCQIDPQHFKLVSKWLLPISIEWKMLT